MYAENEHLGERYLLRKLHILNVFQGNKGAGDFSQFYPIRTAEVLPRIDTQRKLWCGTVVSDNNAS